MPIANDQKQNRNDSENAHRRILHCGLAHLARRCKAERCKIDSARKDQVGKADGGNQRKRNAGRPELRETAKRGRRQQAGDERDNKSIAPAQSGIPLACAHILEKEVAATQADIGRNYADHRCDCGKRSILRRAQRPGNAEEINSLER